MLNKWLQYLSVYFSSMFKFVFGPILGNGYNLDPMVTVLLTVLGMMTTVYLITYFGKSIRARLGRYFMPKRRFSKKSRWFAMIWKRYGVIGLCFLTPLVFTPPGGTLLINLLTSRKAIILKWMWVFSVFWAFLITFLLEFAYDLVREYI